MLSSLFQLSFRTDVLSLQNDTACFPRRQPSFRVLNACPLCQYLWYFWNYWDSEILLLHQYWQVLSKSHIPPEKLPIPENGGFFLLFCSSPNVFCFIFDSPGEGVCVCLCVTHTLAIAFISFLWVCCWYRMWELPSVSLSFSWEKL